MRVDKARERFQQLLAKQVAFISISRRGYKEEGELAALLAFAKGESAAAGQMDLAAGMSSIFLHIKCFLIHVSRIRVVIACLCMCFKFPKLH
jgi:hypothetical protein